jgi:hypothetical protein
MTVPPQGIEVVLVGPACESRGSSTEKEGKQSSKGSCRDAEGGGTSVMGMRGIRDGVERPLEL